MATTAEPSAGGYALPQLLRDLPVLSTRDTAAPWSHRASQPTSPENRVCRPSGANPGISRSTLNQNGSFEHDRIVKSGTVRKRTRKTKSWKKVYLVLRPNLLSIYRNEQEIKLRQQISLSDLTAVARLKHWKHENVFGVFTFSRNYYLEAASEQDALSWVELIRREARIDEEIGPLASSEQKIPLRGSEEQVRCLQRQPPPTRAARIESSSPEAFDPQLYDGRYAPARPGSGVATTRDGVRIPPVEPGVPTAAEHQHEGGAGFEMGSYSELSDTFASSGRGDSSLSLSLSDLRDFSDGVAGGSATTQPLNVPGRACGSYRAPEDGHHPAAYPMGSFSASASTSAGMGMHAPERVVWHGYLRCLRSKGGVRSWKRLWTVLRSKNLALYKTDEEYKPILLIPLSSIIDAVEIDPLSNHKQYCMQIITSSKSFRFCAADEESLARWLGALKSRLVRNKGYGSGGGAGAGAGAGAGHTVGSADGTHDNESRGAGWDGGLCAGGKPSAGGIMIPISAPLSPPVSAPTSPSVLSPNPGGMPPTSSSGNIGPGPSGDSLVSGIGSMNMSMNVSMSSRLTPPCPLPGSTPITGDSPGGPSMSTRN